MSPLWVPSFDCPLMGVCRYDEMGVLFTVMISENTLENGLLVVRNRDTTIRETMHISEVKKYLQKYINAASNIWVVDHRCLCLTLQTLWKQKVESLQVCLCSMQTYSLVDCHLKYRSTSCEKTVLIGMLWHLRRQNCWWRSDVCCKNAYFVCPTYIKSLFCTSWFVKLSLSKICTKHYE